MGYLELPLSVHQAHFPPAPPTSKHTISPWDTGVDTKEIFLEILCSQQTRLQLSESRVNYSFLGNSTAPRVRTSWYLIPTLTSTIPQTLGLSNLCGLDPLGLQNIDLWWRRSHAIYRKLLFFFSTRRRTKSLDINCKQEKPQLHDTFPRD